MLRRIQQLRISLAAKCQLLFGAAVLLIIAAALFVPWHRIEQLTEQLNERTASAVCDYAVQVHVFGSSAEAGRAGLPATQPATRGSKPVQPIGPALGNPNAPRPRLVGLLPPKASNELSRFETRAVNHFIREPGSAYYATYYDRRDGSVGYRYARPVRFNQQCINCHQPVAMPDPELASRLSIEGPSSSRTAVELAGGVAKPIAESQTATSIPAAAAVASSADGKQGDADATRALPITPFPDLSDDGAASRQNHASTPSADPGDVTKGWNPSYASSIAGVVTVDFSSRVDADQLLLNRAFILAALLLASFLAIVTFYYITTRLILLPVRVLQETAEKVAKGDLNIRSDIYTGDEFQQLSETFNTMLTNLKASSDQLRQMNISLDLKLGQLAESNVALYESNRLKSEFLANVSHELRTPLNSILGFADLLKESSAEGKSQRYVGNILTSGRHLLDLINDLLDLAKIEAGKMEVRSEPLIVSDMFEGLSNLLRPLLEQKRLTLTANAAPDVPILQTDPGKLQQVLYNFLSNAIKFSPAGATIEMKATLETPTPDMVFPDAAALLRSDGGQARIAGNGFPSTADATSSAEIVPATPRLPRPDRAAPDDDHDPQVRITVTDHGQGIAAEQQNVIFEKFRQIDAGMTRTHGGTGLGLAISKELTLLMGGTIGVKSKVGEGAMFWVQLPVKVVAGVRDVRVSIAN